MILLGNAERVSGTLLNRVFAGVKFEIGDAKGKSASCFVCIDFDDEEEKAGIDDFTEGAEFVIAFAEACKIGK